ncbi:sulfurtransferase TusA family protein [Fodinicurvata sediminis]|uniref:sulfurtransferase TusA family protein n=1 Tax=Fodinicurvata sediminis TaxID=1121832 RepID=UPI0003B74249|nr:sulfurtransferase TusA family protein [Fodinicurvata sediminis]
MDSGRENEPLRLDTRGLKCPLPVLRARKAIKDVPEGGLLRVESTDPDSLQDFRAYCESTGHELVEQQEEDELFIHLIRKSA